MKTLFQPKALNLVKISSLSLILSSIFLVCPNPSYAGGGSMAARQIMKLGIRLSSHIKFPGGGNNQPKIEQYQYQLPNGQIVNICQKFYPNGSSSDPYYC